MKQSTIQVDDRSSVTIGYLFASLMRIGVPPLCQDDTFCVSFCDRLRGVLFDGGRYLKETLFIQQKKLLKQ